MLRGRVIRPGPGRPLLEVTDTGLLARLFGASPSTPEQLPDLGAVHDAEVELAMFVCSTCGRSDLPEAGDWDPPICLDCDAAINFDAELETEH